MLARSNPKGDGFDLLPVMPFSVIFFWLTLPAAIKGFRGRDLGIALAALLGAAMLNALIFLGVVGS